MGSKMSYLYDRVEDKYALMGGALCAGCTNERGQVQAWKLCQGLDVDSERSRVAGPSARVTSRSSLLGV